MPRLWFWLGFLQSHRALSDLLADLCLCPCPSFSTCSSGPRSVFSCRGHFFVTILPLILAQPRLRSLRGCMPLRRQRLAFRMIFQI
ncbi:hypothetical protein EDD16DRAFT_1536521 [Pisolithus croceorrhizus]|nr:hypothetical protein EDD16DRAFT_1536521 [Pisolithus croceorrhizus]